MTEELPERDLLRLIDPAPRPLDEAQQQRHLRMVRARLQPGTSPRPALHRLLPVLAPVAAAAMLALVLVLPARPGAGAPDAGIPDPSTRSPAIAVGAVTRSGVQILASSTVGDAVFLLGRRGTQTRLAASFDGSDPDTDWELIRSRSTVGPGVVTVLSAANFPDAAPGGLAQLAGQAGTDVTGIDIHDHTDRTHHVAVSNGYYLAAWAGHDFDDRDTLDLTFDIHLKDGTTTSRTYQQLDR